MNELVITIQAVPEREASVSRMLDILGGDIPVVVKYDRVKSGSYASFVKMLGIGLNDYFYRLHLQDDIIFETNIVYYLPYLVRRMCENDYKVCSLFAPNRKAFNDLGYDENGRIVEFKRFLWLQAVLFDMDVIEGMKRWLESDNPDYKHDDVFVRDYLKKSGIQAYCHIPGIVQHNINLKSAMGHPKSVRRISKNFDLDFPRRYLMRPADEIKM